jgi:alkylhydroperoxidase family enzyme
VSRDHGTSAQKLLDTGVYRTSPHFTERERVALQYADQVTLSDQDVDEALFHRLRGQYSAEEIVELTCTIAFENFLSKFHRALRVEPQGFCHIAVPLALELKASERMAPAASPTHDVTTPGAKRS